MIKLRKTLAILLMFSMVVMTPPTNAETTISVTIIAEKFKTLTLDGLDSDWDAENISEYQFFLNEVGQEVLIDSRIRVAYNDTHIAFLFKAADTGDYNLSNHHLSPAMAVQWAIDPDAGPHMGEGGVTEGLVDMWHWELEQPQGYIHSPEGSDGGNGPDNLDDEWATYAENHFDDDLENSLWGAYTYDNDTGMWVFEIVRPLITDDPQDAQFTENTIQQLGLAYWSPNETPQGWRDYGHYTSILRYDWIKVVFGDPALATFPTYSTSTTSTTENITTPTVTKPDVEATYATKTPFDITALMIAIITIPILKKKRTLQKN